MNKPNPNHIYSSRMINNIYGKADKKKISKEHLRECVSVAHAQGMLHAILCILHENRLEPINDKDLLEGELQNQYVDGWNYLTKNKMYVRDRYRMPEIEELASQFENVDTVKDKDGFVDLIPKKNKGKENES